MAQLAQKYGASRVAQTLKQKGIGEEVIADTVAAIKNGEFYRAQQVWSRKFDAFPDSAEARAKQSRYLQSRGFGFAIIRRVMSGEGAEAEVVAEAGRW